MLKITLDTNTVNYAIIEANCSLSCEFKITPITDRELEAIDKRFPKTVGRIPETLVLDESFLDQADLGSKSDSETFEEALMIISNNSFPKLGQRQNLSKGQLNQLRDAMILSAHARKGRDVFVTNDERGFIKHGRRERFEKLFNTKIMTPSEFLKFCNASV